MFLTIYKSTFKNLFRSASFWLIFAILIIAVVQGAMDGFYVGDDDPNMTLVYNDYIECIENSCSAKLLLYIIPIFAVITVVSTLNRDYNDNFFEIEKSLGIKTSQYYFGRIAALITINSVVMILMNFLCLHLYVFTRGGIVGMKLGEYLTDSFVRILRVDLFIAFPCILFYICFTYFIGAILKNGFAAAITSIGYIITHYFLLLIFYFRFPKVYFDYLSPTPMKLRDYFHHFGSEDFDIIIKLTKTSIADVGICIFILVGISIIYMIISYLRIQKRSI